MAPADGFSAPGAATYESNTMSVGDGTWDFTKNTFLLPNLVGFNFETMQYNGMGNRFSTLPQYHTLILAHGVMAAIIFLFIVPASVMTARFYNARPGFAIKYHAQLHILAVLMLVVVFVLGWFAVGPNRSWTNPHHAIGLAVFVMFLLQIIGGRLVRKISGRSLRIMIHQWSGRLIALLGIIQVPLGLTLYGSPRYLFILFSLWMAFLLLLYFILSYRREGEKEHYISGGRSEGRSRVSVSEHHTEKTKKGGMFKWLGPLAAGAGIWALLGRRKKNRERSLSRDRSRSRSRSRGPEVVPSRRGSESFIDDEKYSAQDSRRGRKSGGGGLMKGLLGVGAVFGAGKLISGYMGRREKKRTYDEEYSAVSTETPRRHTPGRHHAVVSEVSDFSEHVRHDDRRATILPPPGDPTMVAQALSAAEPRRQNARPITPRQSHARTRSGYSVDESDYSSYVSPSRRREERQSGGGGGGLGKGLMAGLGMGWIAKKMAGRKSVREEERITVEEDRRSGTQGSRYTGDGFPSPSRRQSRRPGGRPPRGTSVSQMSETSSQFEIRPLAPGHGGPPMPPLPAGSLPPGTPLIPVPVPGSSHSRSRSRHDVVESISMPVMPPDPQGILHESGSEAYMSSGGRQHRRPSARRRRAGEEAAAAAAATAGLLAAEEESRRRTGNERRGQSSSQPVSVKVKVHDDRDRNVTLRRLTDEEAAAARREQRRRRNDSASSLSGVETPSGRRYRRESSQRRAEAAAERMVESPSHMPPLSPPNPAFAGGGRRAAKDSAYYSGQPGPSGATPITGAPVSSVGSPDSHGTWSAMSPSPSGPEKPAGSAAADNRRRRRLERRRSASRPTGTDMFD